MRHNSKLFFGSLRIAAAALFAIVVSSCQTEPDKPVETGTYSVTIPQIKDEHRQPDLVTWKIGSDTGSAVVTGGESVVQIQLKEKVSGDVWLDLWRSGVRIMQLKYVRNTETTLGYASEKREDALAQEIFRQILPSKDSITFAKKLAEQVVSKDSVNRSTELAIALMVGVNRDTLVAEALRIMAQSGNPIDKFLPQGRDSLLGLSIESIHVQVKILVELKVIVTDTNALFPPPPVRVVSNLAMPEQLQAGGDASGVTGKFEATGKIATLIAKVYQDTLDVSRHFEIPQIDLTNRPKDLDLDGKLWVTAKSSAAAGTYRLEVVVVDADPTPNSIKAVVGFKVIPAADVVGPAIEIQSPAPNTVLENDVATVSVKARVEDPSGVDSVWISDKLAVGADGIWSLASVEIPVTDIGFAVVVRAKDGQGNISSKDVLVGRKAKLDPGAPSWTVLSPKANEVFPFDSSSVAVRWKVSDPRAEITKAWIGGTEAAKDADGIWVRRVELPATGALTTVTLVAVNAKGDSVQGFVQVTRQADTKGPMIQIKSPVDGMVFGYDAPSVLVMIAATDPSGVDSVKVNGKPANPISAEYVYNLAMEAGKEIVIQVEAWDKLKNSSADTIKISRKGAPDTTAPRLKLLGPASGTELSIDAKTATLRWLVTDLFGILDAEVKIDGKLAQRTADTFSLEVAAPAPGREESHRIDVKNIKGVSNFETMSLKRAKDVTAPKLARVDSGRTVPFETEKVVVSWKVTDNYKLGSVTIAGKVVTGVDGLYSQEVALAAGDNRIAIVATDSATNSGVDTVTVHRTWKDTSKPSLVRQTGTENKNVPFATTDFTASWKVTDNALAGVKINDITITGTDGIYSHKATLAQASTRFKIEAIDASGNVKLDSITVTKSDDLTDPVVARLPGTKDTTVPYATSTYALGWEVIDDNGVASVTVNSVAATKVGDNYQLTVKLPTVAVHQFVMVAKDLAGNELQDTIRIRRAYHDSIAPQRVRGVNTKDTTVSYGNKTYTLSWTVTDNDKVYAVTIGGGAASVTGSVYSRSVDLVDGANKFGMLATDTAGNKVTDTVTISRSADAEGPEVVITNPVDGYEIAYPATTVNVTATAIDVGSGLASIVIGNKPACTASPCSVMGVAPDNTGKITVVATDNSGKTTTKSITVTIGKDRIKPELVRLSKTGPKTTPFDVQSDSVIYQATDNSGKVVLLKINDSVITETQGNYRFRTPLNVGVNPISVLAQDAAGNQTIDTFSIVRVQGVLGLLSASIPEGNYDVAFKISITATRADATIRYTTDGSIPTATSPIMPAELLIEKTTTIKARGFLTGATPSDILSVKYVLQPGAVVVNDDATGERWTSFGVKASTGTAGAVIRYTLNGTDPTAESNLYVDSILIDTVRTLKLRTFLGKMDPGAVRTIAYNVNMIKKAVTYQGASYLLRVDGSLWASGAGDQGQLLGIGNSSDVYKFQRVRMGVKDIAPGQLLMTNGDLYGFGENGNGQVGNGTVASDISFLVYPPVKILGSVAAIASGPATRMALQTDGSLWVWGNKYSFTSGMYGGNATTPIKYPPTLGSVVTGFAVGSSSIIYQLSDGSVWIKGHSADSVKILDDGIRIQAFDGSRYYGDYFTVLRKGGALWGYQVAGQFGQENMPPTSTPAQLIMGNVQSVESNAAGTFVLKTDNSLHGCGYNWNGGVLGLGSDAAVSSLTHITDNVRVMSIDGPALVVKRDGTLWAAGMNDRGQFGAATPASSNVLVPIPLP